MPIAERQEGAGAKMQESLAHQLRRRWPVVESGFAAHLLHSARPHPRRICRRHYFSLWPNFSTVRPWKYAPRIVRSLRFHRSSEWPASLTEQISFPASNPSAARPCRANFPVRQAKHREQVCGSAAWIGLRQDRHPSVSAQPAAELAAQPAALREVHKNRERRRCLRDSPRFVWLARCVSFADENRERRHKAKPPRQWRPPEQPSAATTFSSVESARLWILILSAREWTLSARKLLHKLRHSLAAITLQRPIHLPDFVIH